MNKPTPEEVIRKGEDIAVMKVIAYQVEVVSGEYQKAVAVIIRPEIHIQKQETKEKLNALSQELSKRFSDILDFDNDIKE